MSTAIVCDMCGWEGTSDELDEINEEIDVARAFEGMYLPDVQDAMDSLGTPCCSQCRTTAIGDCW